MTTFTIAVLDPYTISVAWAPNAADPGIPVQLTIYQTPPGGSTTTVGPVALNDIESAQCVFQGLNPDTQYSISAVVLYRPRRHPIKAVSVDYGPWEQITPPSPSGDYPVAFLYQPVVAWIDGSDIWTMTSKPGGSWQPPKLASGASTSAPPALALWQGEIYLAWRVPGTNQIGWAATSGPAWGPTAQVPQALTSAAPALAPGPGSGPLYLAWKGEGSSTGIWWAAFDGTTWSPQQQVPGVGTSAAPALAVSNDGLLYLAWKGEGSSTGIWWATFDGTTWSPQQQVPGVGTSAAPALGAWQPFTFAPSTNPILAWKGDSGSGLWASSFDGTAWSAQQELSWPGTADAPAITWFSFEIAYLFYPGIGTDAGSLLFGSVFNYAGQVTSWHPSSALPGAAVVSTTPAALASSFGENPGIGFG
jgi:hypothetical protein